MRSNGEISPHLSHWLAVSVFPTLLVSISRGWPVGLSSVQIFRFIFLLSNVARNFWKDLFDCFYNDMNCEYPSDPTTVRGKSNVCKKAWLAVGWWLILVVAKARLPAHSFIRLWNVYTKMKSCSAFFAKTTASWCKNLIISLFLRETPIFSPKNGKNAKNCDYNIDPGL
jgi:hypothetical protein